MTLNPDQFHPHVDHYQSGGLGHRPEDPTRSVVGMVPTHVVDRYKEYDRNAPPGSSDERLGHTTSATRERVNEIREDIRAGKGITNPLQLHYNHKEHWATLGEGNHRLAAAQAEGVPYVPVRVVRDPLVGPEDGTGAPASHRDPGWAPHMDNYLPTDVHPSFLHFDHPANQHYDTSRVQPDPRTGEPVTPRKQVGAHEDIHNLLRPVHEW
jgi:hypothetical protein